MQLPPGSKGLQEAAEECSEQHGALRGPPCDSSKILDLLREVKVPGSIKKPARVIQDAAAAARLNCSGMSCASKSIWLYEGVIGVCCPRFECGMEAHLVDCGVFINTLYSINFDTKSAHFSGLISQLIVPRYLAKLCSVHMYTLSSLEPMHVQLL